MADPCETLLDEIRAALKQAHIEEHLRPRCVARITRAYEQYWKDCGAVDGDSYEERTAQAAQAAQRQSVDRGGEK